MERNGFFWLLIIWIQVLTALGTTVAIVGKEAGRDVGMEDRMTVICHPNRDNLRMKGAP